MPPLFCSATEGIRSTRALEFPCRVPRHTETGGGTPQIKGGGGLAEETWQLKAKEYAQAGTSELKNRVDEAVGKARKTYFTGMVLKALRDFPAVADKGARRTFIVALQTEMAAQEFQPAKQLGKAVLDAYRAGLRGK